MYLSSSLQCVLHPLQVAAELPFLMSSLSLSFMSPQIPHILPLNREVISFRHVDKTHIFTYELACVLWLTTFVFSCCIFFHTTHAAGLEHSNPFNKTFHKSSAQVYEYNEFMITKTLPKCLNRKWQCCNSKVLK